jgi:hypothetical protein
MVRILLNIQLLFYGMTYLMILEKLPILTNLKTFYYLGMEMNANVRGQVIIPTAHCSDGPLFRQPISRVTVAV